MKTEFHKNLNSYVSGHVHKHIFLRFFEQHKNKLTNDLVHFIFSGYIEYRENYEYFVKKEVLFEHYFKEENSIESFERFNDDISKGLFEKEAEHIIQRAFSKKHRAMLSNEAQIIITELVKLGINLNTFKKTFSKKMALIKNTEEMDQQLNNYLASLIDWSTEYIHSKIKKHHLVEGVDFKILEESKDCIYLDIISFKASSAIGSQFWCISRKQTMFDYYQSQFSSRKFSSFVFKFDFSKPFIHKESQVAYLYDLNNIIIEAYRSDDSMFKPNHDDVSHIESLLAIENKNSFSMFINRLLKKLKISNKDIPFEHEKESFVYDIDFTQRKTLFLILENYKHSNRPILQSELEGIEGSYNPPKGLKENDSFSIIEDIFNNTEVDKDRNVISIVRSIRNSYMLISEFLENPLFNKIVLDDDLAIQVFLKLTLKKGTEQDLINFTSKKEVAQSINKYNNFQELMTSFFSNYERKEYSKIQVITNLVPKYYLISCVKYMLITNQTHGDDCYEYLTKIIGNYNIEKESFFQYFFDKDDTNLKEISFNVQAFNKTKLIEHLFMFFKFDSIDDSTCFIGMVLDNVSSFRTNVFYKMKKNDSDLWFNLSNFNSIVIMSSTGRGRSFLTSECAISEEKIDLINLFKAKVSTSLAKQSFEKYLSLNDDFYVDFLKSISYNILNMDSFLKQNANSIVSLFNCLDTTIDFKKLEKSFSEKTLKEEHRNVFINSIKKAIL